MSRPNRITATGNVGPAAGARVGAVVLTAGSDAATLALREGGSGGTIFCTLKAAANTSVGAPFAGLQMDGQLHATFTGTSPEACIELA